MREEALRRTGLLLGGDALGRVRSARVLVMGLGGVGSWCVEALVRAGVGAFGLLDCDVVAPSNLNRQICALESTIGRRKTDVVRDRVLDVNPACRVETYFMKWTAETADSADAPDVAGWDVVVDAIDIVSSKIALAERCAAAGVPLFVALGGGNKLDPSQFEITDLSKTDRCPLAKVMRKKLRKRGIEHLPVVASKEEPRAPIGAREARESALSGGSRPERHQTAGTLSCVVGEEGLLLAHAVLAHIMGPVASRLRCDRRPAPPCGGAGSGV